MIVDASAVLAILFAEPDAERFTLALSHARPRAMSAVNWMEAAIAVDRRGRPGASEQFDRLIKQGHIEVVAYTPEHAALARKAYFAWGKGRHPAALNMGDCAAYALAQSRGEPLLFKGNDFPLTDIEPALKD